MKRHTTMDRSRCGEMVSAVLYRRPHRSFSTDTATTSASLFATALRIGRCLFTISDIQRNVAVPTMAVALVGTAGVIDSSVSKT